MKFELRWIAWEITRRCNLRCIHCRSSSEIEVKNHPDFSKEFGLNILDQIAEFETKPVVVLSGGEPLLREDWYDFAKYGTEKGLRMCLATNGTLVNDFVCEKIKDSGIKMVSLSLDASTPEKHDDFRKQKGAFEGTINAIKLFKKHDIKFLINSSFTKRNQDEIQKVYQLSKELGATAWYMFMLVPTGRAGEILEEFINPEDYDEILKWHYHMEKNEESLLVRPTCAPHYYRIKTQLALKEGIKIKHRTLQFSTGGAKGCIAGQLIALINVDGDVLPCSYFPLSAGNLYKTSLKEIWENSQLLKDLRDFKAYRGKCGSCEYINICGGCRARAYALKGDYLEEEPYCSYIPLKIKKNEPETQGLNLTEN